MPVSTSRYSWRAICAVAQGPQNKAQQASSKPSTPVHVQHSSRIPYFRRIAMRRKSMQLVRRVVVVDRGDTGGLILKARLVQTTVSRV